MLFRSDKSEYNYPMCNLMNGSDEHVKKMLGMRNDILFYSEFLDYYAPAVVGNLTWNDDAKMSAHCCTTDLRTFAKNILSVSDEAFIILVLVNAAPRWMYEIVREDRLVRTHCVMFVYARTSQVLILCKHASNDYRSKEHGQKKAKVICQYEIGRAHV